jgi:hypothetical protein
VDRLTHTSKKLSSEVKTLKEDNQFLLARLQNISNIVKYDRRGDWTRETGSGRNDQAVLAGQG